MIVLAFSVYLVVCGRLVEGSCGLLSWGLGAPSILSPAGRKVKPDWAADSLLIQNLILRAPKKTANFWAGKATTTVQPCITPQPEGIGEIGQFPKVIRLPLL
jgi:hypothetical protein